MNFETAFNVMSDDNNNNLEHLHSKISDDIPLVLGCSKIPDPLIVILEPGKAPNSDDEKIYIACDQETDPLLL